MEGTIADVRCPSCGAPAKYNIIMQQYLCGYCGGRVGVKDAHEQKKGFRSIQQQKIKESKKNYRLLSANCTGCGSELVFEAGDALTSCAFCGRALVRNEYLSEEELPELIIPFRITKEEAANCLIKWCNANSGKAEAKRLREAVKTLEGFYLPYELIRGPVNSRVSRMDGGRIFNCRGYVDNVFVNCSKQLDNLLLDAAEPFELYDIREFDFSYVAGERVKIGDISAVELKDRVNEEVSNDYTSTVRKTLETKAVEVDTNAESVLRMPVLLPMYYIRVGKIMAAVNGQTGKVSVRAEKESHYYFIPWWIKAIISTLLTALIAFFSFRFFGNSVEGSLYLTGMLTLIVFITTLAAFSDTIHNKFRVEARPKIFTSSGGPLRRSGRNLIQDKKEVQKEVVPPVFFESLEGVETPVKLVFSSPARKLKLVILSLVALFLPVIIALFLNGFVFARLELGGSAVWFCIVIPVLPVYILKFGIIDLYENPWIYVIYNDGRTRRYKKKSRESNKKENFKIVLGLLFSPPICFAIWFGIISFFVMCYLTAFGFD